MHFFLRIIHLAYCRGLYRVEEFVFPRRPFFALITACFGGDEGEDELVVLSSSCTVARVVGGPALNFVFLLGLGALAVAVPSVVALDAELLHLFLSPLFSVVDRSSSRCR